MTVGDGPVFSHGVEPYRGLGEAFFDILVQAVRSGTNLEPPSAGYEAFASANGESAAADLPHVVTEAGVVAAAWR
jgi:hypothetical protein